MMCRLVQGNLLLMNLTEEMLKIKRRMIRVCHQNTSDIPRLSIRNWTSSRSIRKDWNKSMKSWISQKWNLTQNPLIMIYRKLIGSLVKIKSRYVRDEETWTWSNWDRLQHVSERWNISQYDVWLRPNYDPIEISKQYLRRKKFCVVFQLIISCMKSQSKTHGSP